MSNIPQTPKSQALNVPASSQAPSKVPQAAKDVHKEPGPKESMTNEGGGSCSPSDKKSTTGGCN